ncbi:MAG: HD domain-containing protein [Candidatus Moraniibacteriota bacterium]
MKEKIQQLESEIRELYLNPKEDVDLLIYGKSKDLLRAFWFIHLETVIALARKMARKYKANEEIIWLSAILHDIGQFHTLDSHEVVGSEKAYEILIKKDFEEKIAQEVKAIILTHRCNEYFPQTLEQKILATADATSHFVSPHYFWLGRVDKRATKELMEKISKKIEKDYETKIFFEDEKEMVKKEYEVLKKWFNYKI